MLHSSYLWLASFGKKQCVYTTNQNVTLIHITSLLFTAFTSFSYIKTVKDLCWLVILHFTHVHCVFSFGTSSKGCIGESVSLCFQILQELS